MQCSTCLYRTLFYTLQIDDSFPDDHSAMNDMTLLREDKLFSMDYDSSLLNQVSVEMLSKWKLLLDIKHDLSLQYARISQDFQRKNTAVRFLC